MQYGYSLEEILLSYAGKSALFIIIITYLFIYLFQTYVTICHVKVHKKIVHFQSKSSVCL